MFPMRCIHPPCMNMAREDVGILETVRHDRVMGDEMVQLVWIERDLVQEDHHVHDDDPDRDERRRITRLCVPKRNHGLGVLS